MRAKRVLLALIVMTAGLWLVALWSGALASPSNEGDETFGVVTGILTDVGTGEPIARARVGAGQRWTTTNALGRYRLTLPAGTYNLRAEADEYVGMTRVELVVAPNKEVVLELEMMPCHPNSEQERRIETGWLASVQQQPDPESLDAERGYGLSYVSEVPATLRVLMPDGTVVVMAMDDYLKGVVPAEVPASWPAETLRAQAVAARSYAATRHAHGDEADVCTTVHCQVWRPVHYDTTDQAVDDTHGVVATYDGSIIQAFFFAHCDGHTRDVEDVWGGYLPYCRGVSCPCGFTSMHGHGVGMCQYGAKALGEQGQGYATILQHYYRDVQVDAPEAGRIASRSLVPTTGDENTQFVFEAVYLGGSGDSPAMANVVIDGRAHTLEWVPGEGDERRYRLVTRLPQGVHVHYFYFDDGHGGISRDPAEGVHQGPIVDPVDPLSPTPTPIDPLVNGVRSSSVTLSTIDDWARGAADGVRLSAQGDGAIELLPERDEGVYVSPVLTAPLSFCAAALVSYVDVPIDGDVSFELRITTDGVTWGGWQALEPSEDDAGGTTQGSDLLFGEGVAAQFRVTMESGDEGASPLIENVRLVCLDTREGPTAALLAATHQSAAERLAIISRATWGADESLMTWPPEYRSLKAIVIHHTATDGDGVDPAAMVRAIYYYHAVVREWGDIGYNYLVDHFGNVYEGRAGGPGVVGGHALRFNWGSIGVGLIGNYHESDVPAAMQQALTEFLAWECADHMIDPLGHGLFIDLALPRIMGHRDCLETVCPGDRAYTLLPVVRSQTLALMGAVPPNVRLAAPMEGDLVRAVMDVACDTSAVVTRVELYVDDVLVATDTTPPFSFRWNTLGETSAPHTLRVMAHNAVGSRADQVSLQVDNVPPTGAATVPAWSKDRWVRFDLASADATAVQFSNGWIWEGEMLYHEPGSGAAISDTAALNGLAWQGRAGLDRAGTWYGPYVCDLPIWSDYTATYRLRAPSAPPETELALLDIVDDQGRRSYAERRIMGDTLAQPGAYEVLDVELVYQDKGGTCDDPDISDGIEFRTAFRANGDLTLDRVTLYAEAQAYESPIYWPVLDRDGTQTVTVRFLDEAGNAAIQDVTVHLDRTPPQWLSRTERGAIVQDVLSGLDISTAVYSLSQDGGDVWWEWEGLDVVAEDGTTAPVELLLPYPCTHMRFSIADMAGNRSDSPIYALNPTPTPTGAPTLPPPTLAPTLVPTATVSLTPMPHRLLLPLVCSRGEP